MAGLSVCLEIVSQLLNDATSHEQDRVLVLQHGKQLFIHNHMMSVFILSNSFVYIFLQLHRWV